MMTELKVKKGPIVFYCKDCEEIVDTIQFGRKYVYKCKKCGTKNVAFGTEKSINTFFRLEEKEKIRNRAEKAEKAENVERAENVEKNVVGHE